MKVYGILVRFNDGHCNINECYTSFEKAKKTIEDKQGNGYFYWPENNNGWVAQNVDYGITYIIKEMEVE